MRGSDRSSGSLFSYVDLESRVPGDHPLRTIRGIVNDVLAEMAGEFEGLYARTGRPSIPPEKLIRALLLQAFYSIGSERRLMEQLDFNLLFRWFVGLGVDDPVWDASTFCKNRDRLLEADVAGRVLAGVIAHRRVSRLLSRDHFSVDGTLIDAWASMKSFRPKDDADTGGATGSATGGGDGGAGGGVRGSGRNPERDFHGEKRCNRTHESTTDREARLYRKGQGRESRLCYMGHALMENRNGLVVGGLVSEANGTAEREAALALLARHRPGRRRVTLAADKGYDVAEFVGRLRADAITPHIAVQDHLTKTGKRRKTLIDGRTTRHPGYALSQRCRKRIEEVFGWAKTQGGQAKTRFRGRQRVDASFTLALAAYNLVRLPRLFAAGATP
jgi:transposase